MASRRPLLSDLFQRAWRVPDVDRFTVSPASPSDAQTADQRWSALRPKTDVIAHWSWTLIIADYRERFAVTRRDGRLAALWAATGKISLPEDGSLYRLDYLEVDPILRGRDVTRGTTFAAFVLALVAKRAVEKKCVGLAIPSLPETSAVYERLGAVAGAKGWNLSPALAPYRMINGPFQRLLDLANEYEEES